MAPLAMVVAAIAVTAPAAAAACPNESLREAQLAGVHLPDCRAYEQVTPVEKDGTNPTGEHNDVEASPNGNRIIYLVPAGMPGAKGSSTFPHFISTRSDESWSSQGALPPAPPGALSDNLLGWNERISELAIRAVLPGTSGAGLYANEPGSESYQALAGPIAEAFFVRFWLAGISSADASRVFFETSKALLPGAVPGTNNLYESHNGALSLVDILPEAEGGGPAPEGGFAGPYAWEIGGGLESGGAKSGYYTQSAISEDGNRVFFTASGTGALYLREGGVATVKVSESQRAVPDPNGPRPAAFMSATPDGSKVFFTSCEKLTEDATAVSTSEPSCTQKTEGQDLYEFDVNTRTLTDLTVDHEAGDTLGAAVQGVLGTGVAEDGVPSVYFVANGILAPGAQAGNCHNVEFNIEAPLHCNLYVSHGGKLAFIATLASGANGLLAPDADNWFGRPELSAAPGIQKTSRVSPNGEMLLFTSSQKLTAYENSKIPELYRYDRGTGSIGCVSCNPAGTTPTAAPQLEGIESTSSPTPPEALFRRNFAGGGDRVYFETTEALVPRDVNGVLDVYEWEAPGSGTCTADSSAYSTQDEGCVDLISSGSGDHASFFADASSDGSSVFFFTSQPLVRQDEDSLVDVYGAREDGGIAAQNVSAPSTCEGEACRGQAFPSPGVAPLASTLTTSAGNLLPPANALVSPIAKVTGPPSRLDKALAACRKQPKRKRRSCEARARKRYGSHVKRRTQSKQKRKGS
jgi:hypothetical protein